MRVINTNIEGCLVIQPNIHKDSRGFFLETYQEKKYSEIIGAEHKFVQDNQSFSSLGVLSGLNFQEGQPERNRQLQTNLTTKFNVQDFHHLDV